VQAAEVTILFAGLHLRGCERVMGRFVYQLWTYAMNAFQFGHQGAADAIRIALSGGDPADIGGVDAELSGNPGVNPPVQEMPRQKGVLVAVVAGFLFHGNPHSMVKPVTLHGSTCPHCAGKFDDWL
jgi:hypothetical protein